eukprot:2966453-Pyramimonas_sp.AAC.1
MKESKVFQLSRAPAPPPELPETTTGKRGAKPPKGKKAIAKAAEAAAVKAAAEKAVAASSETFADTVAVTRGTGGKKKPRDT